MAHVPPFTAEGNWFDTYTQTTMPDYSGGGFSFMTPMPHGLPSESLSRMPPPPPPPPLQPAGQAPHSHTQLPMLMVPSHPTWPSMLTHPQPSSYSAPPLPMPSLSAGPGSAQPAPAQLQKTGRASGSQPRKTLTDEDRREMCRYAERNPGVKQTEIGSLFGVERR
jgi:hypothetical protein